MVGCTHVGSFYKLKNEVVGKGNLRLERAYRITLFRFNFALVDSATCDALSGEAVETEASRIPSANGMQKPPKPSSTDRGGVTALAPLHNADAD
jgi:hypothetical protein